MDVVVAVRHVDGGSGHTDGASAPDDPSYEAEPRMTSTHGHHEPTGHGQQMGYGEPAGHDQPTRHGQPAGTGERRNGFGIAALVLGIVGVLLFWTAFGGIVLGLLAVIFGVLGFRRGRRGVATNGTMAVVGAVLGALALVVSSVLLAMGVAVINSDEFKSYQDCIEQANSQSERQDCARDFDREVDER